MAQLHFADPLPNYQPPPLPSPPPTTTTLSSPQPEPFTAPHLRPVHDLLSMLKGAFNAVLELAPALVADLSPPPSSSASFSTPQSVRHPHQHAPPQQHLHHHHHHHQPFVPAPAAPMSTSIVPLGPSDHSHRSCVDFLRRLLGAGGATELRINALPVRSLCIEDGVDKLPYEQDMCAICLDGYQHYNRVRVLGCEHVFHTSCIDPWLRRGRPTCPLCQTVCC